MDMRQYAGSSLFVTVDSVREGPRDEVIVSVEPGRYDKPVLTFESGLKFSLNVTNTSALLNAYGPNDQDWIGCTIALYLGETKFNGELRESVLARPVSPSKSGKARTPVPDKPPPQDMNDDIPF